MVEAMDHWQDAGLTAGERADLLVIAENANDASRETVGPVHEPYLLKRAGKTAATAWRNSLGKLMKKGALEYAVHGGREMSGFPGRWAVYRIPVLCPDAPHDGLHGQCTRSERVTSQVTQSDEGPSDETRTGNPSGDPIGETGHLSGANGSPDRCERVTSQVTPNPPTPQYPSSSVPAAAAEPPAGQDGGGGSSASTNDNRARLFLMQLPAPWGLGPADAGRLAPQLAAAVSSLGLDYDDKLAGQIANNPGGINNYAQVIETRRIPNLKRPAAPASALPPACPACLDRNPIAAQNKRWRTHNGHSTGRPCTDCHPDAAPIAA